MSGIDSLRVLLQKADTISRTGRFNPVDALSNTRKEITEVAVPTIYQTEQFVQHHVKERLTYLRIYPSGDFEGVTEKGGLVSLHTTTSAVRQSFGDQYVYKVTQLDDGSYSVQYSAKGLGGGKVTAEKAKKGKEKEKPEDQWKFKTVYREKKDQPLSDLFLRGIDTEKNTITLKNDLEKLIKKKSNPNFVDKEGKTLFSMAIEGKKVTYLTILLELSLNPNLLSQRGPPLFQAAETSLSLCDALLDYEADVSYANSYALANRGVNLVDIAISTCSPSNPKDPAIVIRLMKSLNIKPTQVHFDLAMQKKDYRLAELLLLTSEGSIEVPMQKLPFLNSAELLTQYWSKREEYRAYLETFCQNFGVEQEGENFLNMMEVVQVSPLVASYYAKPELLQKLTTFLKEKGPRDEKKLQEALTRWEDDQKKEARKERAKTKENRKSLSTSSSSRNLPTRRSPKNATLQGELPSSAGEG